MTRNKLPIIFSQQDEQQAHQLLGSSNMVLPRLSAALQEKYNQIYFAKRNRYENLSLPIGMVIFAFYGFAESAVLDQYYDVAVFSRAVVVVCLLLGMVAARMWLKPELNEKLFALFSLALPGVLLVNAQLTTDQGVALYNSNIMLVVMYMNVIWLQRFKYAFAVTFIVLVAMAVNHLVIGLPQYVSSFQFVYIFTSANQVVVIIASLFVNYLINISQTRNFLNNVLLSRERVHLQEANKKIERAAIIDSLSGLFNRRFFDEELSRSFNRAHRHDTTLSLLFLDIDYFKRYNDSLGHQKGDICLLKVANILKQQCRESEICCRYGGEEFVVIVEGSPAQSEALVKRIHDALAEQKIAHPDSPVAEFLTISIGVCSLSTRQMSDEAELVRCADSALYQAKHNGRNQTCFWQAD